MLLDSFVRSESPQAYGVAGRNSTAARQGEWTNYQTKAINLVNLKSSYAPRLSGPIQFLHKLLKFWKLERRDAIGLLGYESGDAIFVYDMLKGRERPRGLDFKSRISHLLSIRAALDFFSETWRLKTDGFARSIPFLLGGCRYQCFWRGLLKICSW